MFQSLFNPQWETYTDLGMDYDRKASHEIQKLVDHAVEQGVSLRDLAYILHGVVDGAISGAVLERNMRMKKEQKNGQFDHRGNMV